MTDLQAFTVLSKSKAPENKKFLRQLRKKDPARTDRVFHEFHEEVFREINCVECANCCKTTSPIITSSDVERLARDAKMKPGKFVEKYLKIDDDGDYVFTEAPCPFLGCDNLCSVYEARPKACREYPHTNRKKIHQILDLTFNNTQVCPATLEIVERAKRKLAMR